MNKPVDKCIIPRSVRIFLKNLYTKDKRNTSFKCQKQVEFRHGY